MVAVEERVIGSWRVAGSWRQATGRLSVVEFFHINDFGGMAMMECPRIDDLRGLDTSMFFHVGVLRSGWFTLLVFVYTDVFVFDGLGDVEVFLNRRSYVPTIFC